MKQNTFHNITGNFVSSIKTLLFLSVFFFGFGTHQLFAQEKQLSEVSSIREEISKDTLYTEETLVPTKEELLASEEPIKEEPTKLTQEQSDRIAELDKLLSVGKLTREEYEKLKAEVLGTTAEPVAEETLMMRGAGTEPESQTLGKYLAPQVSTTDGSLNYEYPLVLPPGRNGLTPELSLTYNSGNKSLSSVIGTGWSFNIPYIQRTNKKGSEKLYTENTFTSSLDGELVDQGSGIYIPRVDNGSFRKYQYLNNQWTITEKDGSVYQLGTTAQARQDHPTDTSKAFIWMLETVTDTNGNTITYTYYKDQGQIYPATITYADGLFVVSFIRAARTQTSTSYQPGFKVVNAHYISEVTVTSEGSLTTSYDITRTGNLVTDIQVAGHEGGTSFELPAVGFGYTTGGNGTWTKDLTWDIPKYGTGTTKYTPMSRGTLQDVNGDGLSDYFVPNIYSSTYSAPTLDNDYGIYINNGNGTWTKDLTWDIPKYGTGTTKYTPLNHGFFQDMNGDGLVDYYVPNIYTNVYSAPTMDNEYGVYINNGNGTWTKNLAWDIPKYGTGTTKYTMGKRGVLQDINGDGLSDYFVPMSFSTVYSAPNLDNEHGIYINNGNGTWTKDLTWDIPKYGTGTTKYTPMSRGTLQDVNGDGLSDYFVPNIYSSTYSAPTLDNDYGIYINNGNGTWTKDLTWDIPKYGTGTTKYTPLNHGFFQDMNGDGLVDYYVPNIYTNVYSAPTMDNEYGVYINNGNGTWTKNLAWDIPKYGTGTTKYTMGKRGVLQDINGDGLSDYFVPMSFSTVYSAPNLDNEHGIYINNGNGFANLSKITSPTQGETNITYTTARIQDVSNKVPFTLDVINAITTNDKEGNLATTTYGYRNASYYYNTPYDKKFAGFGTVIKTNPDGSVVTTKYHQANGQQGNEPSDSYAKIGKAYEQTLTQSGDTYTKTRTNYVETPRGTNAQSINVSSELTRTYDGGASSIVDTAMGYSYDSYGNILTETQYGVVNGSDDGSFSDNGSDKRTTTSTYINDTVNYIVGLPTSQTLTDANGTKAAETIYTYNPQGNLLNRSSWIAGNNYQDTSYTYNPQGNMTSETDALLNTTSYAYNSTNLYPTSSTNALGQTTQYGYDLSSGKPTSVTDPSGKQTLYDYDGLDRLIEVKESIANGSPETTKKLSYITTSYPNSVKETQYQSATQTQDSYTYLDGFGKTIQTKSETNNGWRTLDTKYNAMGQVQKQSLPYRTSSSTRSNPTSNNDLMTTFSYDPLGRVLTSTNAKGTTETSYQGFQTNLTDAEGNQKYLETDAFGNLTGVTEMNNGDSYDTTYRYNAQNLLTNITDAEGNIRGISYDGLGRRTTLQDLHALGDASFGTWTFNYNDLNLVSQSDPKGTTTTYTYDPLNRVTTENNSGTAGTDITYTYDSCTNGTGKLCSSATPAITTSYTYFKQGPVSIKAKTIDGTTYTFAYEYNRKGDLTKTTYPNASWVATSYTKDTLPSQVSLNGNIIATASYAIHGRPDTYTSSNGMVTTFTYDPTELYELVTKRTEDSEGFVFQDLAYTYDSVGNITSISDTSGTDTSKEQTFTYDDLYRLTGTSITNTAATTTSSESYTYSPIGNILSFTGTPYSYTNSGYANPHAVTNIGTTPYSYDNNGNLVSDGVWTHTWDYRNRLVSSQNGSTTSTYTYDTDNQRVKHIEGSTTTLSPDTNYEITNGVPKLYLALGDTTVATHENNVTSYLHTDHLGGTNIITDENGDVVTSLDYYPYGATRVDTGTHDEDRQYTGYTRDVVTGLDYAVQRYYLNTRGRFLSQDPVALALGNWDLIKEKTNGDVKTYLSNPQKHNSYSYAFNNPVKYEDQNGEWAIIDDAVAIGAGFIGGIAAQGVGDIVGGELSSLNSYVASGVGGAVTAEVALYSVPTFTAILPGGGTLVGLGVAGVAGGLAEYSVETALNRDQYSAGEASAKAASQGISTALLGGLIKLPNVKIPGVNAGKGSFQSVSNQIKTKLDNGTIKNVSAGTLGKIFANEVLSSSSENVAEGTVNGATRLINKTQVSNNGKKKQSSSK
jgi:RHS repeat-associated protein